MSEEKDSSPVSRRSVLKATSAASAAAVGVPGVGGAMPGKAPTGGKTLEGKRVFQSKGLDVDLPEKAEGVGGLKNADVAMVGTDSGLSRGRLVSAIKTQTPITFVGPKAAETLVSTVFDVPKSEAAAKAADRSLEMPNAIDKTVSMAFPQNTDPQVATLWPTEDELSTHMSGTVGEYTDSFVLGEMDVHFSAKTGGFTTTSSGDYTTTASSCSDAAVSDEWNCKDPNSVRHNNCPKGVINRDTRASKAVESDGSKDFFAVEIKQGVLPNTGDQSDCDNQGSNYDWRTKRIDHSANMGEPSNYTWNEEKHIPDPTADNYNTSFSIGGSIGVKTATVNANYSWSRNESGIQIDEHVDDNDNVVGHDWYLSKDVGQDFFEARSGFRADATTSGVGSFGYSFDNRYKFKQPKYIGSETKTYTYTDSHYWTF